MSKKGLACCALAVFLSSPPALLGQVSFTFDYSSAPDYTAEAKAALEEVADFVGSCFNHTATIDIEVTSSNADTSTLASAGSNFFLVPTPGFDNRGIVGTKILGGTDANGADFDGTVDTNFFHNWSFSDTVGATEFDFKSIMIHELLHAIGFTSGIQQTGEDSFTGSPDTVWLPFDEFVADSSGSIIDGTSHLLDQARWDAGSVGGAGAGGLQWNGANALAASGGSPIYLYTPTTWEGGSSVSHLDDQFYTSEEFIMEAQAGTGSRTRTISDIELGMLQDLGFSTVTTKVPEPSVLSFVFLGACFLGRRGRTQ